MPCVDAATQVRCHLGYEPSGKDRVDMLRLRDRFGIELPAPYDDEVAVNVREGSRMSTTGHGASRLPRPEQAVILITGIQAAGKSTVAQALAERLPRSVHVRGDRFRRMVVNGRHDMNSTPDEEAVRQLRLRHRLTAQVSDGYFEAGFTVVAQDVILGEHLAETVALIRSAPLLVVVLAPRPGAVQMREDDRAKKAYDTLTVQMLDGVLREETAHLGLWIDSSFQTPAETVDEILARAWTEGRVQPPSPRSRRPSRQRAGPALLRRRGGGRECSAPGCWRW